MKNVSQSGKNPTKVSYFGKSHPNQRASDFQIGTRRKQTAAPAPLNWLQEKQWTT
jgi:hypothetical protein